MQSLHTEGTVLPTSKSGRLLQSSGGSPKDKPRVWSRLWKSYDQGEAKELDVCDEQSAAL